MNRLAKIEDKNIDICTKIYIETYSKEPWNEEYDFNVVENYINRFILRDSNHGWILYDDENAIGIMLGIIIPTLGADYFRIEDLCISPNKQYLGYGSTFIKMISNELISYNVDSILLNTVEDFPSYKFYLKNKFTEINTSRTLYLDLTDGQF
ncbi:GNAT family N-acetyltransferase [uncultured Clostridium sp.]|uniref:GNAT family N-acetyltransferase n=1 Tax=uncultured Clostridium sp. TaxID=59620 RepID=UPI0025F91A8C|nr:GNAT family N-acetyltransferase [uncultured Clostridium sp.]